MSVLVLTVLLTGDAVGAAREVHSNGLGGGRWSDPGTWHGEQVPGEADLVVIAARDTVIFDMNHEEAISCAELSIDPQGVLAFRPGANRHVMRVAGPIESYGTIRMDATGSPLGHAELHLIAESEGDRVIRLHRRGQLLAYGNNTLPDDRRNILIASLREADGLFGVAAITAGDDNMLDLHYAQLRGIHVQAERIDNTGFEVHQRLNLLHNVFSDGARVELTRCDTPAIRNNRLHNDRETRISAPALMIRQTQLAQVQNNFVSGYQVGIHIDEDVDSSLEGNVIENCQEALRWRGANAMIKRNTIRDCEVGIVISGTTGVIEHLLAERIASPAIRADQSRLQLTSCRFVPPAGSAEQNGNDERHRWHAVSLDRTFMTLLNCDLTPESIQVNRDRPPGGNRQNWVEAMEYLVVGVQGGDLERAQVDVRTAGSKSALGEYDPNVRNSPAMLGPNRMTALPGTFRSLIVRSWNLPLRGDAHAAPEYDITVYNPPSGDQNRPRMRATVKVRPDASWHRPEPDAAEPTLELTAP